jgi:hypothetical protein
MGIVFVVLMGIAYFVSMGGLGEIMKAPAVFAFRSRGLRASWGWVP